ncbi:hypothetical protein [Vallitalea okinawensis]|uniref:hypothetical protein n=1 Tax=Vallitalea okinawensis TaxID=2078660 RepID=UPI000CFB3D08|nr:hypothetical protein [Vallitalea okinawensis]
MKNLRKLIVGGTLILTMSTTVLAGEVTTTDKLDNSIECTGDECYFGGFGNLTAEQEAELKQLESEIDRLYVKLEPLYAKADEIVKDLDEIDFYANFDNFKKVMIKESVTADEISKAKELYKNIQFEENNSEEDWEKVWDAWVQLEELDVLKESFAYSDAYDVNKLSEANQKELADLDSEIMDLEKQLNAIYNKIDETYDDYFYFDDEDFEDEDFMDFYEEYTFEDFKSDYLKEDATKAQISEAKSLFEKAMKLEEDNDWDEATKVWDELFEKEYIIEIEFEMEPYTFEDFKMELKDDLSKDDLKKAEELFNQAMQLEEKEKYDEAWEVWEQLWSMDIYDFDYDDFDYEDYDYEDMEDNK